MLNLQYKMVVSVGDTRAIWSTVALKSNYRNLVIKNLVLISKFATLIFVNTSLDKALRIPVAYPAGPDGPIRVRVVSGSSHGVESPVRPLGGCWYFHVIFDKEGMMFQDIRMQASFILQYFIHLHESLSCRLDHFLV